MQTKIKIVVMVAATIIFVLICMTVFTFIIICMSISIFAFIFTLFNIKLPGLVYRPVQVFRLTTVGACL